MEIQTNKVLLTALSSNVSWFFLGGVCVCEVFPSYAKLVEIINN